MHDMILHGKDSLEFFSQLEGMIYRGTTQYQLRIMQRT